jgi:hypothetical protein
MAAGTLGEVGPIVAMSLLLSTQYSTWQEIGFLFALFAIIGTAIVVGMKARPPKLLALLGRQMHASTQLPVRISLLVLTAFMVLADQFGFEVILGAFAVLFLLVRGAPVFLYRDAIARAQRLPFALSSAVPLLSIIVVITEIGVRAKMMNPDVAAALIGAALLSVLLFPTIAGVILQRIATLQAAGSSP